MPRPCYLFDIDGTIADCEHRRHHVTTSPPDWEAFFQSCDEDEPIKHVCALIRCLHAAGASLVFVSGRPERIRLRTKQWLERHGVFVTSQHGPLCLYMRADGDRRPDDVVKYELLKRIREDGWEPIMAFDDRDRVVKMWRENGVPCVQVAPGDF